MLVVVEVVLVGVDVVLVPGSINSKGNSEPKCRFIPTRNAFHLHLEPFSKAIAGQSDVVPDLDCHLTLVGVDCTHDNVPVLFNALNPHVINAIVGLHGC